MTTREKERRKKMTIKNYLEWAANINGNIKNTMTIKDGKFFIKGTSNSSWIKMKDFHRIEQMLLESISYLDIANKVKSK